jgi:hypothetical protein
MTTLPYDYMFVSVTESHQKPIWFTAFGIRVFGAVPVSTIKRVTRQEVRLDYGILRIVYNIQFM